MQKSFSRIELFIILGGCILLGICVPNATHFIHPALYSDRDLAFIYLYFCFVFLCVWVGNRVLLELLPKLIKGKFNSYFNSFSILLLSNIVYTVLVSGFLFNLWLQRSVEPAKDTHAFTDTVFLVIIITSIITNLYQVNFFKKDRRLTLTQVEQLNMAKIQAELESLRSHTDPHFLFNSLNTLSYLIGKDQERAKLYTTTLSNVYRYILINKEKDLVLLKDELEFICNYFYLIRIRFGESVNLSISINDLQAENYFIPPMSMQLLVENAIKHNEFNDHKQLGITVTINNDQVIVRNPLNPKLNKETSTETGLSNLQNRFLYMTSRPIVIEKLNHTFTVKLPLIKSDFNAA